MSVELVVLALSGFALGTLCGAAICNSSVAKVRSVASDQEQVINHCKSSILLRDRTDLLTGAAALLNAFAAGKEDLNLSRKIAAVAEAMNAYAEDITRARNIIARMETDNVKV